MKMFFREVLKEVLVSVFSTFTFSLATYYGGNFINEKFELAINSKIIILLTGLVIILGFINFIRKIKKKRIDSLQEPCIFPIIISDHDAELTVHNQQILYRMELIQTTSSYRRPFENIEKKYFVSSIEGPLCATCELKLKEKRSFWGKYKHFCPRGHVTFKNEFSNYTMSEHKKIDTDKVLREKGIKHFNQ